MIENIVMIALLIGIGVVLTIVGLFLIILCSYEK
jgi:hypothetical protein